MASWFYSHGAFWVIDNFHFNRNCPVCDKPALYENLVIDGYFQEVIASPKLGPDDNEIQLHPDGSWSTLSNKTNTERESPKKSYQKVELIEDDLGTIRIDWFDFDNNILHILFNRTYNWRISQVIDQIKLQLSIARGTQAICKWHSGDLIVRQWRRRRYA